jgi:hypothetical protein
MAAFSFDTPYLCTLSHVLISIHNSRRAGDSTTWMQGDRKMKEITSCLHLHFSNSCNYKHSYAFWTVYTYIKNLLDSSSGPKKIDFSSIYHEILTYAFNISHFKVCFMLRLLYMKHFLFFGTGWINDVKPYQYSTFVHKTDFVLVLRTYETDFSSTWILNLNLGLYFCVRIRVTAYTYANSKLRTPNDSLC